MDGFDRYRSHPTAETLTALLQAVQGRVYTLCYQVLRHPEDARDVSQQVLLKLLDAIPRMSDGDHLKRWIPLVCFRESLNFRKKLRIQTGSERAKAARVVPESVPPEDALEIHEHIASLREDLRTLVLERFFEHKSLPMLAVERRCSTVAIWKKLERAKQSLRESMMKAGTSAGALVLDGFLESLQPVAPPDGLITPAILAKTAKAGTVPAAAMLGGILMTGKGISTAAVAAIALFCLTAGMSAGVVIGSSHRRPAPAAPEALPRRDRSSGETAVLPGNAAASLPPPASALPTGSDSAPGKTSESLPDRLKRFRDWLMAEKPQGVDKTDAYCRKLMREWRDLRPLVLKNPDAYAAFLRATENEEICPELMSILNPPHIGPTGSICNINDLNLSAPIRDTFLDFLASGSKAQKDACLQLMAVARLNESDAPLVGRCLSLLSESDPEFQKRVLAVFGYNAGMLAETDLEVFRRLLQTSTDTEVKQTCLNIAQKMNGSAAESLILEEAARMIGQKNVTTELIRTLQDKSEHAGAEALNRYSALFAGAIAVQPEEKIFRSVAQAVLHLPPNRALPLLEQGYAVAPNADLRDRIGRTIQRIRSGETRRAILESDLEGPKSTFQLSNFDLPFAFPDPETDE